MCVALSVHVFHLVLSLMCMLCRPTVLSIRRVWSRDVMSLFRQLKHHFSFYCIEEFFIFSANSK